MTDEKKKQTARIAIAIVAGIVGAYILNKMGINNWVYDVQNNIREGFMGPTRGGAKIVHSAIFKLAAHAQVAGAVGTLMYVVLGGKTK